MTDPTEDAAGATRDVNTRRLAQAVDALADVQLELDRERLRRRQSEALFDRLFESLSDAVLLIDPQGIVTRANGAAATLFDRPAEQLVDADAAALYRGEIPCTPWALLDTAPDGALTRETAAVTSGGDTREISLSCAVVRDARGRVHGALHAARDLSEVHRLLREVTAAEERWRMLAHVGSWFAESLDPDEVFEGVVTALERDSGLGIALVLVEDGVVGGVHLSAGVPDQPGRRITSLQGSAPPRGSAVGAAALEGRSVHAPSVDDGFPLLGSAPGRVGSAAVLGLETDSDPVGALIALSREPGAVDDPTFALLEEVAARLALSIANMRLRERLVEHRAAHEATAYRDEIIAAVSHEMKSPLAVLVGHADALADPGRDHEPEQRRLMHASIGRQARRLRRLVIQFLDYVRTEAGRELSVSLGAVDVERLVRETAASMAHEDRIVLDLDDDLPPVTADELRLELALANLLTNALKYAPDDTPVTITARRVGPNVEISVVDRGPGIAPPDQADLFDKFVRGPGETGVEGTGLGLYMTRNVMRSQGGDVRVASRPGHGSRFTLVLEQATHVELQR